MVGNPGPALAASVSAKPRSYRDWFTLWQAEIGCEITEQVSDNLYAIKDLITNYGASELMQMLSAISLAMNQPGTPLAVTYIKSFVDLRDKWQSLKAWQTNHFSRATASTPQRRGVAAVAAEVFVQPASPGFWQQVCDRNALRKLSYKAHIFNHLVERVKLELESEEIERIFSFIDANWDSLKKENLKKIDKN